MTIKEQVAVSQHLRSKSQAAAIYRDAAIAAGKKVAIASIGPDGRMHICTVQSIRSLTDRK